MELLHLNIIQYWNLLQVQTLIQYATVIMPIVFLHSFDNISTFGRNYNTVF